MKDFHASNGLTVRFISRYRDRNDYRITEPDHTTTHHLTVCDDGSLLAHHGEQIRPEWTQAYNEYKTKEAADFEIWRAARNL